MISIYSFFSLASKTTADNMKNNKNTGAVAVKEDKEEGKGNSGMVTYWSESTKSEYFFALNTCGAAVTGRSKAASE